MEITEVRVKLTSSQSDRVRAFCSVTLDREFVVRDIKVIEGTSGLFVAMPSRKISDHCPKCKGKNHLRARYCNECGTKLRENRAPRNGSGRSKLHADIAHPINMPCRERLQEAILKEYEVEIEASKEPGYRPVDLDTDSDDYEVVSERPERRNPPPKVEQDHEEPESDSENAEPDTEFDTGAEYAALIAELRNGRPSRRNRDDSPKEQEEKREEEEEEEEAAEEATKEPATLQESQPESKRKFGKGIL
ncbi:MAG: septation protein SpoVG family protein [Phycisphaerae bacterium]|nr:septation protein SpoVG family protein [Phycisphaerae bacterium]